MSETSGGWSRREFVQAGVAAGLAVGALGRQSMLAAEPKKPLFEISLAEWSFHKAIRAKKMTNLDFPAKTRECGIDACEYVNQFFMDKAKDEKYLKELQKRCKDEGIKNVLIMCDNPVKLGDPDEKKRKLAAEDHHQWVDAAKFLGCHSIRVNAHSEGSREEQAKYVADGLRQLCEYAAPLKMNVIVENHGGLSSDGKWLSGVMKAVNLPNCGTLPDFGNFYEYDRYQGVKDMMPFAKGVSAKSYAFDDQGNETKIDYRKMMKIVLDAGYHGRVGIEWEGEHPDEMEGVLLTKRLLEKIREEMSEAA
jgi:sugar phosphate isomerase/epimerase